ncbi:MAG: MFS transporter [Acidobacteriota bacterium]|nr:MFS transporter [Acidobacteriota bacterium]
MSENLHSTESPEANYGIGEEAERVIKGGFFGNLAIDLTPLKISRDYRLLFFGQLISAFGSMMSFVAIPVQMYQLTESSLMVGLLGIAEFLPVATLAFVGGALADTVDRRKMLRLTEIGQTIVTFLLLANALLPKPQIWILFLCAALHAAFAALQRPSFESLIQKITPPHLLTSVAALNAVRWNTTAIAGPAVGGILIGTFGAVATYAIDLVTFVASLAAVWLLSAVPVPENAERPSLKTIIEGIRYAFSRQELLGTYLIDINAMFFGMPIALFPAIADKLNASASVGLFYSAVPAGALVVTLTSGWTRRINRHGLMVAIAAGLWGLAIIGFGLAENLWLALFFLALAGAFDMISGIFRSTIWNQTIPNRLRGRLAGIEMISYLTGPHLGNVEAGIVASMFSVRTSVVSGGVFCVLGTLALCALLPKFLTYDGREGLKRKELEETQYVENPGSM